MTPHTVAVTFANEPRPTVYALEAFDSWHAVLRVFAEMPPEKHASFVRVQVSPNISTDAR